MVIRKGANYGWPLREGTEARSLDGMGPIPQEDTIPIQISDTLTRGTITADVSDPHIRTGPTGGDAIANGFASRLRRSPRCEDKLVFGDITAGRVCMLIVPTPRGGRCTGDGGAYLRDGDGVAGAGGPRRTAHEAAKGRSYPARPRSPAAGAWTCGSRSTRPANSMSLRSQTA